MSSTACSLCILSHNCYLLLPGPAYSAIWSQGHNSPPPTSKAYRKPGMHARYPAPDSLLENAPGESSTWPHTTLKGTGGLPQTPEKVVSHF